MKFFCILFAFYTVSIAVMPCNDVHGYTEISVTTAAEAQDHHEEDNDACSPFCICACCQTVASVVSFFQTGLVSTMNGAPFNPYSDTFISSTLSAIWQPPKLG